MRFFFLTVFIVSYIVLGVYVFFAIKYLWKNKKQSLKKKFSWGYWVVMVAPFLIFINAFLPSFPIKYFINLLFFNYWVMMTAMILFMSCFLFFYDIKRGLLWSLNKLFKEPKFDASRSQFIRKATLGVGLLPFSTLSFGIISGAHDYQIRNKTLFFKTLPTAFDGFRMCQISDIHTGSNYNKMALKGGIEIINSQKPDIVFFTGDLVNNQSSEARDYLAIFKKITCDLGVYSIMGNHDYGDYHRWQSEKDKFQDIKKLHDMHRFMGWNLLLNEHRILEINNQEIAILGVENWGVGRFSKYGNLKNTYQGTEAIPFKILLSHDPSHWDAQIRPQFPDIDLTLSGHTHGFQFGVEWGSFRWSPSQYMYEQWADLYQKGNQQIYVNRGFGYIGYLGRVGILPEITMLELKKA